MSGGTASVYQPKDSQKAFITPDVPVKKWFGFHSIVIPVGTLGRLFREGEYVKDLPPGRRTWWSPFGHYSVSVVDARVRLLETAAKGKVPGPEDRGQATPPAKITVPMTITVQLANIDTLLNVDRPLDLLEAMIGNHVAIEIGKLRYDQYRSWVATLRDELQRYLQLNALQRVGLQVLEVFVGEPDGETEADKRQLRLYQTATAIKDRVERQRADNQARVESAAATRQEAQLLGVDAWLRELSRSPEGLRIIEADVELRKMAIAAGLIGSQSVSFIPQPSVDSGGPAGGGPALLPGVSGSGGSTGPGQRYSSAYPSSPSSGNGGPSSGAYTGPTSDYPTYPSQQAYTATPTPTPAIATDPSLVPGAAPTAAFGYSSGVTSQPSSGIDASRLDAERARFPAGLYVINETPAIVDDASGTPVHGYQFVLSSVTPPSALRVSFDLAPGYPQSPPSVLVKRQGDSSAQAYRGPAVQTWTPASWLADVLAELAMAQS